MPGAPAVPTSRVGDFDDELVPFLGDPEASRTLGITAQVITGIVVAYNVVRAVLWLQFAALAQRVVDGDGGRSDLTQLTSLGNTLDAITVYFWPSAIGALVIDAVWRRKRRPKDVLQSQGEAYVEAPMTRVIPVALRVIVVVAAIGALFLGFSQGSGTNLRPGQVPGFAYARAASSLLWAVVWSGLIFMVAASRRHLARRVAKANDPTLSPYSVPYVVPEVQTSSSTGASEGVGWLLRTSGLLLAGMFALIVVIASAASLPSGKDTITLLIMLVLGLGVIALVTWAFVRRYRRNHPAPT